MDALWEYDEAVRNSVGIFCGVDEAGRGPLAGDVYAAAVILNPDNYIEGLNDSKKLSEKKREKLYDEIIEKAFELLGDDIAVVHCKDYVVENDELKSIAAGTGGLNYPLLLKKIKEYKPYVHCTLENTVPENAVATREFMEKLYAEV